MVKLLRSEDREVRRAQCKISFVNYQHGKISIFCNIIVVFSILSNVVHSQQNYALKLPNGEISRINDSITSVEFMNTTLHHYYLHGYALAIWQLDSIGKINASRYIGYYTLQPGKIIQCDSILYGLEKRIRPKILSAMLDWKKGKVFIFEDFEKDVSAINQSNWISISPPQLYFQDEKVSLRLRPEFKKSNEISALLGLQPSTNGKSTLIGDFHFLFRNALHHAEKIEVQWQRQALNTQRLQLEFNLPYCFGSPMGIGAKGDIYRRSDQFLQTQAKIAIQYYTRPSQTSEIFIHQQSTIALNNGSNSNITQRTVGAQIQYQWKRPSCSLSLLSSYSRGSRMLQSQEALFTSPITITDHSLSISPFWRKFFLSSQLRYWFQSPTAEQSTEWKRIGGNATFRGFQQESIFARTGVIIQNALGVGNENTQQFFLFMDYGQLNLTAYSDFREFWSWGLGAFIQTANGGIQMNYGWGKFPNQRMEYRNGIVNLSYQVYF
jgi:hypothetical protein